MRPTRVRDAAYHRSPPPTVDGEGGVALVRRVWRVLESSLRIEEREEGN